MNPEISRLLGHKYLHTRIQTKYTGAVESEIQGAKDTAGILKISKYEIINENQEPNEFWTALGGQSDYWRDEREEVRSTINNEHPSYDSLFWQYRGCATYWHTTAVRHLCNTRTAINLIVSAMAFRL